MPSNRVAVATLARTIHPRTFFSQPSCTSLPLGTVRSFYNHKPSLSHGAARGLSGKAGSSSYTNSNSICQQQRNQSTSSATETAKQLSQKGVDEALSDYDEDVLDMQEKQNRAPWHREGVDKPPVERQRSSSAMKKGKLLTTPSRLLKLVLPLTTIDNNPDRQDIAPLALLIHPQQPLSYLERLIQSELPNIKTAEGDMKIPAISFRAMEAADDEIKPRKNSTEAETDTEAEDKEDTEELDIKHRDRSSGKILGEGSVQGYSGAGREGKGDDTGDFVRWSASTEIGDFIRDAARAKEFEVEIEGYPEVVQVAVPSFNDRTFYLRQRLRRVSGQIAAMARLKKECDDAAHRAGQRLALAGCGGLIGYWYVVYRLTFETDLGWDVMEPVTYLVGLSTLIGGYMWFLYHNREVSYRSALNVTISKRQSRLYEAKGFNPAKWESLIEDGNALRKEIKAVAAEYDVDWDERAEEKDEAVTKALRKERRSGNSGSKKKGSKKDGEEDDDDD